ncbi:MAG: Maf family protein, partial [Magnetococcales bacterium]|nr:Maf family protein [Magnetococcales bacterium]
KLMGKPHDDRQARRMLKHLSGRTHKVMTAIALLRPQDSRIMSRVVTTRVTFKPLRKGEINQYIASKEPLDKAGAYGIQGLGALLVKKIHGSYSGVVGLPLTETVAMIQRLARMKKPVEP